MSPLVLIVSKHESFASAATQQLKECEFEIQWLRPKLVDAVLRNQQNFPDVAFVDYDAKTSRSSPVYQQLQSSLSGRRIVLIATLEQASGAARRVRSGDVSEYVLVDAVEDAERIPLVVERVLAASHAAAPTEPPKQGDVVETLADMRRLIEHEFAAHRNADDDSASAQGLREGSAKFVEMVDLRIRRLEELYLRGQQRESPPSPVVERTILVVEDDPTWGAMAKNLLERRGFRVTVAPNPDAAKAALNRGGTAMVLMDVNLGDDSGLDVVSWMRSQDAFHDLPVIMVTADRTQTTVLGAAELHVSDYLIKPYRPSTLLEKVATVLEKNLRQPMSESFQEISP